DFTGIGPGDEGYSEIMYQHNIGSFGAFYGGGGVPSDSYITLILNPEGNTTCYLDNLDFRTESKLDGTDILDDIFYKMEAKNSYQSINRDLEFLINQTNLTTCNKYNTGPIRRIGRIWRTPIMDGNISSTNNSRILDTFLTVTLRYNNGNNKFKIHDVITYYRSP